MGPDSTPDAHPETPVTAEVVPQVPPYRIPRRKSGALRTLLLVILIMGFAGSLLLNLVLIAGGGLGMLDSGDRVREKYHSLNRRGRDKIAVITIKGAIIDGEGFIKRQIDRAAKDKNVKAVVLRVDSPGGTVTASDYIYHHLCKLREEKEIPIVVSMGGVAASGGYYVSMAAGQTTQTVFAEPTTWTGSIGVLVPLYNLTELMGKWGIKEDTVASHRLKTMGSLSKPMTPEEREIWQALINDSFERFKEIIKSGRPEFNENPEKLDKLATGQIFTARQAQQNGLIDKIGFIEDAIDRAVALAGLDKDDVCVVKYKPEPTLANILVGGEARSGKVDLAALLEFTSPRAYYLYTSLPAAETVGCVKRTVLD